MKVIDKSKITITILSIVFVLSLSVTITLAAFSANKTGDVTLTFADGLTMRLESNGISVPYTIATADENATTFTFGTGSMTSLGAAAFYGGVIATLNKSGWIAYKFEFFETTSGSEVAPTGAFTISSTNEYPVSFLPTGNNIDWIFGFMVNTTSFNSVASGNSFVSTSKTILSANSLSLELFNKFTLKGRTNWNYVNALGGRSFKFYLTIKARTDAAPTF